MDKLVQVQKTIAKKVLKKLELFDKHCILAGGAPRDWFFGKPATDLDFYLYDPMSYDQTYWIERISTVLENVKVLGHSNPEGLEPYASMEHLRFVLEGNYDGVTVQVMIMQKPTFSSVVNHFCADNSKIWWKGDEIVPTTEFLLAFATRTLVLNPDCMPHQRWVDKVQKKFPDLMVMEDGVEYNARMKRFVERNGCTGIRQLIGKWIDMSKSIDKDSAWLGWWSTL